MKFFLASSYSLLNFCSSLVFAIFSKVLLFDLCVPLAFRSAVLLILAMRAWQKLMHRLFVRFPLPCRTYCFHWCVRMSSSDLQLIGSTNRCHRHAIRL